MNSQWQHDGRKTTERRRHDHELDSENVPWFTVYSENVAMGENVERMYQTLVNVTRKYPENSVNGECTLKKLWKTLKYCFLALSNWNITTCESNSNNNDTSLLLNDYKSQIHSSSGTNGLGG